MPSFSGWGTPVWIKVSPDTTLKQARDLYGVALERDVRAIIVGNSKPVLRGSYFGMSGAGLQSAAFTAIYDFYQAQQEYGAAAGTIRVKRKSDGQTGTIDPKDFDPKKYERVGG